MSDGVRLVTRISKEIWDQSYQVALRSACTTCTERRAYFSRFYEPGIAQRVAAITPAFDAAKEIREKVVAKNRIMTGNRYTGFMYKV